MRLTLPATAAMLSFAIATADANIIYDNGGPVGDLGATTVTTSILAQDFTFAAGATVGGAGVYLSEGQDPASIAGPGSCLAPGGLVLPAREREPRSSAPIAGPVCPMRQG